MVDRQGIRANDQLGLPLPPTLECAQPNEALVDDKSFFDEFPLDGLPPLHFIKAPFRSWEAITENRISTPLLPDGSIDIASLIRQVNDTVEPEYTWPGRTDVHHLYCPGSLYDQKGTFVLMPSAPAFRELPANKIVVPRLFHNWLHLVTLPPVMPSERRMKEAVDEWKIFKEFYDWTFKLTGMVRLIDRETQNRRARNKEFDEAQRAIINAMLTKKLGSLASSYSLLQTLPPDRLPFSTESPVTHAAGRIGVLVKHGHHQKTRAVRSRIVPSQTQKVA